MKILAFGVGGVIGSAMCGVLSEQKVWQVPAAMHSADAKRFFPPASPERLMDGIRVEDRDALLRVFAKAQRDIVVNCIGLTRHNAEADDAILEIRLIPAAASTDRVMRRCQGSIDSRKHRLYFFDCKGRICRVGPGGCKRPEWERKTPRRAALSTYDPAADIGDQPRIRRFGWDRSRHVLNAEFCGPWPRRTAAESGFPSRQLQQDMESSCGF